MRSGNNFTNNDREQEGGRLSSPGAFDLSSSPLDAVRYAMKSDAAWKKSFHKIHTCSGLLSLHRSIQFKKARVKTRQYGGRGVHVLG